MAPELVLARDGSKASQMLPHQVGIGRTSATPEQSGFVICLLDMLMLYLTAEEEDDITLLERGCMEMGNSAHMDLSGPCGCCQEIANGRKANYEEEQSTPMLSRISRG